MKTMYAVDLTPAGMDEAKAWIQNQRDYAQSGLRYHFSTKHDLCHSYCQPDSFVVVTGIFAGEKAARAEFQRKWVTLPGAKLLPDKAPDADKIHQGQANFQLYDDGSRLVDLALGLDY